MTTKISRPSGCMYCRRQHFTRSNLGESYRINVSGGWVHYGCVLNWLVDDAITRNFPGIESRERRALKHRIKAPELKGYPSLTDLSEVGRKMQWSGSMRASQVQQNFMRKFQPDRTDAAEQNAARWTAAQPALVELQQLHTKAEYVLRDLTGENENPEGYSHGGPRM